MFILFGIHIAGHQINKVKMKLNQKKPKSRKPKVKTINKVEKSKV